MRRRHAGKGCDEGNRAGVGGRRLTGLNEATEELCLLYSTEPTPVSVVTGWGNVKRERERERKSHRQPLHSAPDTN